MSRPLHSLLERDLIIINPIRISDFDLGQQGTPRDEVTRKAQKGHRLGRFMSTRLVEVAIPLAYTSTYRKPVRITRVAYFPLIVTSRAPQASTTPPPGRTRGSFRAPQRRLQGGGQWGAGPALIVDYA